MPDIPPDGPASPAAGQAAEPQSLQAGATLGWCTPVEEWEGAGTVPPYGPPRDEYREGAEWFATFMRDHELSSEAASHVLGVNPARIWEWLHAQRLLSACVRERLARWAADGRPRFAYWDPDQYRGWGEPECPCTCDGTSGAPLAAAITMAIEPVASWTEAGVQDDDLALLPELEPDDAYSEANVETGAVATGSEVVTPGQATGEDLRTPTSTPVRVRPHQYRPPAPPRAPGRRREAGQQARERGLEIDVRVVFDRSGDCQVLLLPQRAENLPEQLFITGSGKPRELLALQDEWYQGVPVDDPGLLQEGVTWSAELGDGKRARWSMGGRTIYVLARHQNVSGFINTARLVAGEAQVVLCLRDRLEEVREVIGLTGSPEPQVLDEGYGVPSGWVCLRGVTPGRPVPPREAGDILNVLCPVATIEIVLDGGISINGQVWLAGYPPQVRVHGDVAMAGAVMIDSRAATQGDEGSYIVAGWDLPGRHTVQCGSKSKSYEIREAPEAWDVWDAYTWSMGEQNPPVAPPNRPAVCGVLVRPPQEMTGKRRLVLIPASHRILLGALPGQVQLCSKRGDIPVGKCTGYPEFDPVWALPADPFRCDKRTTGVLLVGEPRPVTFGDAPAAAPRRQVQAWCNAICCAGRKGLETEPGDDEISLLWQQYKRIARSLQKRARP